MMKARCKNCFVILRGEEISASNECGLTYEFCLNCIEAQL
jgi:hypothetical protein